MGKLLSGSLRFSLANHKVGNSFLCSPNSQCMSNYMSCIWQVVRFEFLATRLKLRMADLFCTEIVWPPVAAKAQN